MYTELHGAFRLLKVIGQGVGVEESFRSFFARSASISSCTSLAVLSHLWARFAHMLDHYGRVRSHRRASARRGEASLCLLIVLFHMYIFVMPLTIDTIVVQTLFRSELLFEFRFLPCSGWNGHFLTCL